MSDACRLRITSVQTWPVRMRLREPYAIAYETIEETTNVFVRIETAAGPTGFGCAGPDQAVTGETAASVLRAVGEVGAPLLAGRDPLLLAPLIAELAAALPAQPAALALLEMALYDVLGKARGAPLYRLLGAARDGIETSVTIGILPSDQTVARARELAGQGFRRLKIKGGVDAESDAARVLAVREAVGDRIGLCFDANQGFSADQAVDFARRTASARLEFIEQPTPRDRPDLLGEVARCVTVPVMADESLVTFEDAERIIGDGLAGLVNLKLMKVGGIAEASRIDAAASAAGIGTMVGCMDEAALGIAAGLHFALARPNVQYADLDGHFDLMGDPSAGAVLLENGMLRPTDRPGLGFDLAWPPTADRDKGNPGT